MPELCAYCGERPGVEREHVVAKMFFPKAPNPGLTVPACKECNSGRGDGGCWPITTDETYFRDMLWMRVQAASHPSYAKLRGRMVRSVGGREAYRDRVLRSRVDNTIPIEDLLDDGVTEMDADANRMARVIRKIVRGLWFHHTETHLPKHLDIRIDLSQHEEMVRGYAALLESIPMHDLPGAEGVFRYKLISDSCRIFWYFEFVGGFVAIADVHGDLPVAT